ncbi:MAG TPA: type II toxin-antitoxin system HicB family antitoxin [Ktedonobacterales bacterium]
MAPEHTYRFMLTWSELDHAWIAEVPELPGCMADGASPAEAVANAEIIIGEWIAVARKDGRPIPAPQHHDVPASA